MSDVVAAVDQVDRAGCTVKFFNSHSVKQIQTSLNLSGMCFT